MHLKRISMAHDIHKQGVYFVLDQCFDRILLGGTMGFRRGLLFVFIGLHCILLANAASIESSITIGKVVYRPPSGEIKYSYFYYFPESALTKQPLRILFYIPNVACSTVWGSEKPTVAVPTNVAYQRIEDYVRNLEISRLKRLVEIHGYVLLIVVVPRNCGPDPDFKMNTPSMVRWVMFPNSFDKPEYEFYKRPDLEFVKIIDNFITLLKNDGYKPYDKVFMLGFSAGGSAAHRFSVLHPTKVAAVAIGAAQVYLYPVSYWEGIPLPYPVGTYDVDRIPGTAYSLDEFKRIPHFVFIGEQDVAPENDPVNFEDICTRTEAYLVNFYFGKNPVERTIKFVDYLQSIGMKVTLKIYSGVGHQFTFQMLRDVFIFFDSVLVNDS